MSEFVDLIKEHVLYMHQEAQGAKSQAGLYKIDEPYARELCVDPARWHSLSSEERLEKLQQF